MHRLNARQVAGMNLAYLFFPLTHFLDAMVALEVESIELWGGIRTSMRTMPATPTSRECATR